MIIQSYKILNLCFLFAIIVHELCKYKSKQTHTPQSKLDNLSLSIISRFVFHVYRIKGDQQHFVRRDELKVKKETIHYYNIKSGILHHNHIKDTLSLSGCLGDFHTTFAQNRRRRLQVASLQTRKQGPSRSRSTVKTCRLCPNTWVHMDPSYIIMNFLEKTDTIPCICC